MSRVSQNNKSNLKSFNKNKLRIIKNVQSQMNKVSICRIYAPKGEEERTSLIFENKTPIRMEPALQWTLENIRFRWDIMVGVFCRDQKGKNYAIYSTFQATEECYPANITNLTINACQQLFEKAPKMHKLCPFWIAVPRSNEEDKTSDLMINVIQTAHYYKVFNRLGSEFELNCNLPYVDYHTGKQWFDIMLDFNFLDADLNLGSLYDENPKFETEWKDAEEWKKASL